MSKQGRPSNQQIALAELSRQEECLREQIDTLECALITLKKAKVILLRPPIGPGALISTDSSAYENMAVGGAIIAALEQYPTRQWTIMDLARELRQGGVCTKSVHFTVTVNTTLQRFVKDRKVVRIPMEGMKVRSLYRLKQSKTEDLKPK